MELLEKLKDEFWAKFKNQSAAPKKEGTLEDYEKIRVIGSGSFGRVVRLMRF